MTIIIINSVNNINILRDFVRRSNSFFVQYIAIPVVLYDHRFQDVWKQLLKISTDIPPNHIVEVRFYPRRSLEENLNINCSYSAKKAPARNGDAGESWLLLRIVIRKVYIVKNK